MAREKLSIVAVQEVAVKFVAIADWLDLHTLEKSSFLLRLLKLDFFFAGIWI